MLSLLPALPQCSLVQQALVLAAASTSKAAAGAGPAACCCGGELSGLKNCRPRDSGGSSAAGTTPAGSTVVRQMGQRQAARGSSARGKGQADDRQMTVSIPLPCWSAAAKAAAPGALPPEPLPAAMLGHSCFLCKMAPPGVSNCVGYGLLATAEWCAAAAGPRLGSHVCGHVRQIEVDNGCCSASPLTHLDR